MALKLKNNLYLRCYIESNDLYVFEIYKNAQKRSKIKNSTSSDLVCAKYEELIDDAKKTIHDIYIKNNVTAKTVAKFVKENELIIECSEYLNTLQYEYSQYIRSLRSRKGPLYDFAIIKKYILDVDDTIPETLEYGILSIDNINITDNTTLYEAVKSLKRFGKTSDC